MASEMTPTPTPLHGAPELPEPDTTWYASWANDRVKFHSTDQIYEFANARVRAAIQQAAGAVPEGMVDLLQSCRGSVKADLLRYEQMILRSTTFPEQRALATEATRLRALLDSIDALAASPAVQPDSGHLGAGGRVPLSEEELLAHCPYNSPLLISPFRLGFRAAEAAHGINPGSATREDGHG